MPSIIWGRDPQEAIEQPYEYECQDQFCREATVVLSEFSAQLEKYTMTFTLKDTSVEKAIWMLQNDAVDSLKDILESLQSKMHRIAGKLFRDILESLNLAAYFHSEVDSSKKNLQLWYAGEFIPHRIYREYIKDHFGESARKTSVEFYNDLSKFTHRNYYVLLYGYVLGAEDRISYDGYLESDILILPHTIAMYYAMLSQFIFIASDELQLRGLISQKEIDEIWERSLESETVPRRFKPIREVLKEGMEELSKKSKDGIKD